jgi:hypothetical protein
MATFHQTSMSEESFWGPRYYGTPFGLPKKKSTPSNDNVGGIDIESFWEPGYYETPFGLPIVDRLRKLHFYKSNDRGV